MVHNIYTAGISVELRAESGEDKLRAIFCRLSACIAQAGIDSYESPCPSARWATAMASL